MITFIKRFLLYFVSASVLLTLMFLFGPSKSMMRTSWVTSKLHSDSFPTFALSLLGIAALFALVMALLSAWKPKRN